MGRICSARLAATRSTSRAELIDAPLADVPEPFGLTLSEACTALTTLVASPGFAGLTVTEINPDHMPDQEILPQFTRMLVAALVRQ